MKRLTLSTLLVLVAWTIASEHLDAQPVGVIYIHSLILQLDADEFDVREQAQAGLIKAHKGAFRPVVKALFSDNQNFNTRLGCRAVIESWTVNGNTDDHVMLFELLGSDEITQDPVKREEAKEIQANDRLVSSVKLWLDGNGMIRCRTGSNASVVDSEYQERDTRLLSMLPSMSEIYLCGELPSEFYEILKVSSFSHVAMNAVPGESDEFSTEAVKAILEWPNIQQLELRDMALSEEAVKSISNSLKITSLGYHVTRPEDLAKIANMPSLTNLTISGRHLAPVTFSAEQVRPLTNMNLEALTLQFVELRMGACEVFSECPYLERIELYFPTDDMVAGFASNSRLKYYQLSLHPANSDLCISRLTRANHIRELLVRESGITDVGLQSLAEMTFLDRLEITTGLISRKGASKIKASMKEQLGNYPFYGEHWFSEEESQGAHELAGKGMAYWSNGPINHIFVFRKNWSGSDEDVVAAMNLGGWSSIQFDIPLTKPIMDAAMEKLAKGKAVAVYDSGQHPEGAIEFLKANYTVKPLSENTRVNMLESAEGEAWYIKGKRVPD